MNTPFIVMTIFMKLRKGSLLVSIIKFIHIICDIYCQSKDKADFHKLRNKLEHMTCDFSKEITYNCNEVTILSGKIEGGFITSELTTKQF